MKRFLLTIGILLFAGCKTIQYVPVKGETIVKDSLIVETRIDTIKVKLPPEKVRDWTGLTNVLELETSLAISRSWVDTTLGVLSGEIVNKEKPLDVYVPSTHTLEKKDSIVYQQIPYPVEVEKTVTPKLYPWSLALNLILISLLLVLLYFKIKGLLGSRRV